MTVDNDTEMVDQHLNSSCVIVFVYGRLINISRELTPYITRMIMQDLTYFISDIQDLCRICTYH